MKKLLQIISFTASLGFLSVLAEVAPASAEAKAASVAAQKAASDSLPNKNASKDTILKAIQALTKRNPVFTLEIVKAAFEKYNNKFSSDFTRNEVVGASKKGLSLASVTNSGGSGSITEASKSYLDGLLNNLVPSDALATNYYVVPNDKLPLILTPAFTSLATVVSEKFITSPSN